MAWNESIVTVRGMAMLNELLAGRQLTITHAVGGTGKNDVTELGNLSNVKEPKQTLRLLGIENQENGKKIKLQIVSEDLTAGYQLQQIGVFAKLDDEDTPELLFIMQDERDGIAVPSEAETPGFIVEFYAFIAMTNDVQMQIVVDSSASVSVGFLEESISAAIRTHETDEDAHGDIRNAVATAQDTADEAMQAIRELVEGGAIGTARLDVTVPADGWVADEDTDGQYALHCDISIEDVTEEMAPLLTILPTSLKTAEACRLGACVQTLNGALRVYAKRAPTEELHASLVLMGVRPQISGGGGSSTGGGTGGGTLDANIASDAEMNAMLDEVFSSEVTPQPGGAPLHIASNNEAEEMFDEVFEQN